jgi:hypothetical protein
MVERLRRCRQPCVGAGAANVMLILDNIAECKKNEGANDLKRLPRLGGRPFNVASNSRCAATSSSRRKRTEVWRMRSTVSETTSPLCSGTLSPRMRPSSRISLRSGRFLSSGSMGCGLGMGSPFRLPSSTDGRHCRNHALPEQSAGSIAALAGGHPRGRSGRDRAP